MVLFTAWPGDNFVWLHPRDISISKASLAIQKKARLLFPTALPSRVPTPWPGCRPSPWRCLMSRAGAAPVPLQLPPAGAVGQTLTARPQQRAAPQPAVSKRDDSCQQPIRQQKHPGTFLAEDRALGAAVEAVTATSMAFIYFCECPYTWQLLWKWYISLQTAQVLLLAGNSLDSKSVFRAAGELGTAGNGRFQQSWSTAPGPAHLDKINRSHPSGDPAVKGQFWNSTSWDDRPSYI